VAPPGAADPRRILPTGPRIGSRSPSLYPELDRHVDESEMAQAFPSARDARLWRLDRRWWSLADRVSSTRWL
jgi:hypothetical protein